MVVEKALAQPQSFEELISIAKQASVSISFWGWRHIRIEGYEGSVSRYALSIRMTEILDNNSEFNEQERANGKKIASLVNRLYMASDKELDNSCFLTHVFCIIRELWMNIFVYKLFNNPKSIWEADYQDDFYKYTKNQYITTFKKEPPTASSAISPSKWYISDVERTKLLLKV